jgi:hypothetical protein
MDGCAGTWSFGWTPYKWQKTKPKTVGWTLERVLLRMGPVMGGCMSLAGLCLWRLGSGHSHVHCKPVRGHGGGRFASSSPGPAPVRGLSTVLPEWRSDRSRPFV